MWVMFALGCATRLPEAELVEPICFLVLFDEECATGVGRCDECADSEARWFECADGWESNRVDQDQAMDEVLCHCEGNCP